MNKVLLSDVENNTGLRITNDSLLNRINSSCLEYENLNSEEMEEYILSYLKALDLQALPQAGQHRITDWENGWTQNLDEFKKSKNIRDLIPKYHTKNAVAKLNKKIIKTFSKDFDYHLHSFFVDAVLLNYLSSFNKVFEFGCGTGYHLFRLNDYFPNKNYIGLDWAESSKKSIDFYTKTFNLSNINAVKFDYYKPDYNVNIKDSLIYTVASLEQIGDQHTALIDYFLSNKPGLCIHFEPIHEVLDDNNLIDFLNRKYFLKRNYLKNYLTTLRKLEKQKKLEIITVRRLNYGSKFIEGHTLIIWKPI